MKKTILKIALVFGAVIALSTGCKKDSTTNNTQTASDVDNLVAQVDPITQDAATADASTGEISMINDGINENMTVIADDIDATEGPAGGSQDSADSTELRRHIRAKSFIFCLRKLDLSQEQITKIKRALVSFEDCKGDAVKRARAIYAQLKDSYKEKAAKVHAAFKDGKITEAQYKQSIEDLRIAFVKDLRAMHLQEKIDVAFRGCMRELLGKLKLILTDAQWTSFVACQKK